SLPDVSEDDQVIVLCHELKLDLEAYLRTRPQAPQTLAELIAFNRRHAEAELVHFGQQLFERADQTGGLAAPEYVAARLACLRAGRDGIDDLLREHQLDALVMPGYPPAWAIDLVNGDHVAGGSST